MQSTSRRVFASVFFGSVAMVCYWNCSMTVGVDINIGTLLFIVNDRLSLAATLFITNLVATGIAAIVPVIVGIYTYAGFQSVGDGNAHGIRSVLLRVLTTVGAALVMGVYFWYKPFFWEAMTAAYLVLLVCVSTWLVRSIIRIELSSNDFLARDPTLRPTEENK